MTFSIAIHKDPDQHYGVTFLIFRAASSAGDTHRRSAASMAKEAIELHLDSMLGRSVLEHSHSIETISITSHRSRSIADADLGSRHRRSQLRDIVDAA